LEVVAGADALVLAAPVYFMSPPGALMALMDRLLTMGAYGRRVKCDRPAAAITVMGNHKWRGVAVPMVSMTASLLGFDVVARRSLVAEGPGEIIMQPEAVRDLEDLAERLVCPIPPGGASQWDVCPVCGSDFFRIEPPAVVCPVCGFQGDLDTYLGQRTLRSTGREPRWGIRWLERHIDDWILPSVSRYRSRYKQIARSLRDLRRAYTEAEERGRTNVH
jgi:multimeric flavodoxin WrbA